VEQAQTDPEEMPRAPKTKVAVKQRPLAILILSSTWLVILWFTSTAFSVVNNSTSQNGLLHPRSRQKHHDHVPHAHEKEKERWPLFLSYAFRDFPSLQINEVSSQIINISILHNQDRQLVHLPTSSSPSQPKSANERATLQGPVPKKGGVGGVKTDATPFSPAPLAFTTSSSSRILPTWKENLATTTLLILAHDRPDYLRRSLDAIHKYHPGQGLPRVIISEDGQHPEVASVVEIFRQKLMLTSPSSSVRHLHFYFNQSTDISPANGYIRLAEHYKYALGHVFLDGHSSPPQQQGQTPAGTPPDQVIILEEDLEIAPDFFNYFGTFAPLLQEDRTLFALSAWNDNGQTDHVKDPSMVIRTDFFPGLGWMMTRRLWEEELKDKWRSIGYWDDWLREPLQRKGRQTLAPEVCRTYHFGMSGTSNGQFSNLLNGIKLNEVCIDFTDEKLQAKLAHIGSRESYDRRLSTEVCQAAEVESMTVTAEGGEMEASDGGKGDNKIEGEAMRLSYRDTKHFMSLAEGLGIFSDEKAGVFRTSYRGIVGVYFHDRRVYLVPQGHECGT
jgi:alpha-1,3-mannosyl-glycoprotein beta-1,2-N-acetylglucosaminyltransferase